MAPYSLAQRVAAEFLGTALLLATVIGVSEASISRMRRGEFLLHEASKPFELAVLFVRLFRSLGYDAITHDMSTGTPFANVLFVLRVSSLSGNEK